MNVIVYTFRTFPHTTELEKYFNSVFVFEKLKEDFEKFSQIILRDRPKLIIGIARSDDVSRIESTSINRFDKNKKITADGAESYKLYVPNIARMYLKVSEKPSDSFCNWTMYKISELIAQNNLETKLGFVDIKEEDLPQIANVTRFLKLL